MNEFINTNSYPYTFNGKEVFVLYSYFELNPLDKFELRIHNGSKYINTKVFFLNFRPYRKNNYNIYVVTTNRKNLSEFLLVSINITHQKRITKNIYPFYGVPNQLYPSSEFYLNSLHNFVAKISQIEFENLKKLIKEDQILQKF